jgi:hypothetical protein
MNAVSWFIVVLAFAASLLMWVAAAAYVRRRVAAAICRRVIEASSTEQSWFAAFSGSETFDCGNKKPLAFFKHPMHAAEYVKLMWPGCGYIETATVHSKFTQPAVSNN